MGSTIAKWGAGKRNRERDSEMVPGLGPAPRAETWNIKEATAASERFNSDFSDEELAELAKSINAIWEEVDDASRLAEVSGRKPFACSRLEFENVRRLFWRFDDVAHGG